MAIFRAGKRIGPFDIEVVYQEVTINLVHIIRQIEILDLR